MKITVPSQAQKTRKENNVPPLIRLGSDEPYYFEQIKALRAKLETLIDAKHLKIVAVTSAIAGEGKTLSCANLAVNLASAGRRRVLLVDMDLRKSEIGQGMGVKPLPGLSEFIGGAVTLKEIQRDTFVPGLQLIPAGRKVADPTDLLAGERLRIFLGHARQRYDIVLLDTPPILPVADTLSLRDQIDGFLFLFRAGFTPHPMLGQALEEVGEDKIIGVVLNGVEPKGDRYYHRYYGNYYHTPARGETPE